MLGIRFFAIFVAENFRIYIIMQRILFSLIVFLATDILLPQNLSAAQSLNNTGIKSPHILILAASLLIIAIATLWIWFHIYSNNIQRRASQLIAEKEETVLNIKMIEEQEKKALLEKNEVINDCRIKEIELDGKNDLVEQLLKAKEALDRQIEEYTKKINVYEQMNDHMQELFDMEEPYYKPIVEDIIKLVNKKLSDKKDYIESLKRIDDQYLSALKNRFNGNLSTLYIKYCVCFAIGMEIGEVSECFSIEQASVHMIRYRLKKKFGLANHDLLDIYLRNLNSALSAFYEINANTETEQEGEHEQNSIALQ